MDSLVHTRNQGAVETVEFTRWTCSEEGRPSAGKVMATVFWDSQGVIYIDYLEKGKTVTGLYNTKLLGQFAAELQKIRPHLGKKKVLRPRQGQIGRIGLRSATPSFFLFPNLKKSLAGQKFASNEEIVAGTSLGQVYRAKRRLCWEINRHFFKIFVFLLEVKYLSDHPRRFRVKGKSYFKEDGSSAIS